MKRRELIRNSILGIGASALALSGCDKKEQMTASSANELNIVPKQTAQYEFSCPMPFDSKVVDEIASLNSTLQKSKVASFYNNTPNPLASKFNQWIQVTRGDNNEIKTHDDFFKCVKYVLDHGFKFTYLMNSPKPFSEKDFNTFKDEMKYILERLHSIGCKDIKVGNTQVATLINQLSKDFNIHISTSFGFYSVSQYRNLFTNYPNITLIDVSNDENHNFRFLSTLRNNFPKTTLELMVSEQCIKGCPARTSHISEYSFCAYDCVGIVRSLGPIHYLLKTGIIYPWNLEYYSALGINNFKYVAANYKDGLRSNYLDITGLKTYLECIEYGTDNYTAHDFFTKIYRKPMSFSYDVNIAKNIKLSELKKILPNVKQFIAHGHECIYKCGKDCSYCHNCAKKIENLLLYS